MNGSGAHIEARADCIVVTGEATDRSHFRNIVRQARGLAVYGRNRPDVSLLRESALHLAASPLARPMLPDVEKTSAEMGTLQAWWFQPRGRSRTAPLLYLHGGGYVCGSVAGASGVIAALALGFGAPVLAVDYRQAPEHPFPAAVQDARDAYQWLCSVSDEPITLVGESAGAALALGTALTAAKTGYRPARALIAICGWFDLTMQGASWRTNRENDLVSIELGEFFRECYLAGADPTTPGLSPLDDELSGAPPLLIQAGGCELALDDAAALAARARGAGVPVRYEVYAEMPHGFLKFASPIGDLAIRRMVEWETNLQAR